MAVLASAPETSPGQSQDLTGTRVVVVGGKVGMGLGIARAARAAGATVIVASRRSASGEEQPDLADFEQVRLDVRDETAVREAFDAIGSIDHLVVTAAPDVGTWGHFMDDDMTGARSYMDGKFFGSWAGARYASPHLATAGSITF